MKISGKQLAELLVNQHYLSSDEFDALDFEQLVTFDDVAEHLVLTGSMTPDLLGQAISEFYSIPYVDLNSCPPEPSLVTRLPWEIAYRQKVVLVEESDRSVLISSYDPEGVDLEVIADIFPSKEIRLGYSLQEDVQKQYFVYRNTFSDRLQEILQKGDVVVPEIVNELFEDALSLFASDIHFEPFDDEVLVRFRIDGVLQEIGVIPSRFYPNIVNRLKVLASLRLDEHYETQDGAIRYQSKTGVAIDMRISIVPIIGGEKIAIRILRQYVSQLSLEGLGLSEKALVTVRRVLSNPFGMILVSGPTGSGKTTTLYAAIRELIRPEVNIMTIEDPVEYRIPRVSQIQVNIQKDITFPKALRSIVRQDPDVILVGEIRDQQTAEIATNASMTGHLVLSTFHANDARATLPRLHDLGVEQYLLGTTVDLIIAQRLVRKICDACRVSKQVTRSELIASIPALDQYLTKDSMSLFYGKGCQECGYSGYKGRTAVFEVLEVTPEVQAQLTEDVSRGMYISEKYLGESMFEDGISKVIEGVTTFEELLRVVKPPKQINEKHHVSQTE